MSKVKKEPGYAGLILIYGLILILRMLHIASLDKLFNKKYRFYFSSNKNKTPRPNEFNSKDLGF